MDCLFCKIINKELPSRIIYEDELVLVIMDAFPDIDGHTLIIPKKHFTDFFDLPDELVIYINKISKKISKLLIKKLDCKSLTLSINYGDKQAIKHYHLHLLPDYGTNNSKEDIQKVFEKITSK